MRRRWFKTICLTSEVLLGLTVGLTIAALWLNPWKQRLSVTDSFHIGLFRGFRGEVIGRIVFFNDREQGPYGGSIIGSVDAEGNLLYEGGRARLSRKFFWRAGRYSIYRGAYVDEQGEAVREDSLCDLPGIYYRRFEWAEVTVWTLAVSLWYPLFLFGLLPGLLVGVWLMRRGQRAGPESQPQQVASGDGGKASR